jgi:dihydrodipicolinate synthase/N-acetylneuraminate lyase
MRKKVYSASITPLMADGRLDIEGLNKIFERNIRHGLDGIFILGSMGECRFFSDDFRDQMIEESVKAVDGRTELLVGITAQDLEHALDNMKRASAYSFDSYVFMLPKGDQVKDPVRDITVVLNAADRPVYYYHCPPANGGELSLAQFEVIMSHPNL